ncbi:arginyl-tRNA synthetase [Savitreella phatthalungensis]
MTDAALANHLSKLDLAQSSLPTGCEADHNPVDIYKAYAAQKLAPITGLDVDLLFNSILLAPTKAQKGDLQIPISPKLGKLPGKPADVATEWASKFPEGGPAKVEANGMFLTITLEPKAMTSFVVPHIISRGKSYGTFDTHKGKRCCVEFSSPNIAKPFHAGHLRSTILGGFISNLYETVGWDVTRINYLGDWGKQYGLLAVGFELFGDDAELEKDAIKHLFNVYVKVNRQAEEEENAEKTRKAELEAAGTPYEPRETLHDRARAYFRKMEDKSETELAVWSKFRNLSIEKLQQTYARLNVRYDHYSGESQVSQESMDEALEILRQKGLMTEDKGAQIVDLTPYSKKLGKAIVQKRDGTTLYLTRDIGEAKKRFEQFNYDKSIYVVASQQDLHLAQLFKILELMGYDWAPRLAHINYGMVQGMSTRKGTAVFLDEILEEAKTTMHAVMRKNEDKYAQIENPEFVADTVGITGVMVQDMAAKRINNYDFSWDRMLSFEGDTGPYLQYAHSRLCSVQRKAGKDDAWVADADTSLLSEPAAVDIVKLLMLWPETVKQAYKVQEASTICTYLFRLSHAVSSAYDKLYVANREESIAKARLALFIACRITLNNGMKLLGLHPLERM